MVQVLCTSYLTSDSSPLYIFLSAAGIVQDPAGLLTSFTLLCPQQSLATHFGFPFSWVICNIAEIVEEIPLKIQKSKLLGKRSQTVPFRKK